MPAAVGVDIGWGMAAVRTQLTAPRTCGPAAVVPGDAILNGTPSTTYENDRFWRFCDGRQRWWFTGPIASTTRRRTSLRLPSF